jgi:hypothetical protein
MAKLTSRARREHRLQRLRLTAHAAVFARDAAERARGEAFYASLDPGIRNEVRTLIEAGVETFESCEGTDGHCYPEPTVAFEGEHAAALYALHIAVQRGLPVDKLRRVWHIGKDGMPDRPRWEMTFHHPGGGGLQYTEGRDGFAYWTRVQGVKGQRLDRQRKPRAKRDP